MCILICTVWGYISWVINYVNFAFQKTYTQNNLYGLHLIDSQNFITAKYTPYMVYLSVQCVCINVCLGDWITPTVTGDRPPPISNFTLTSVTNNTAVLFGGHTTRASNNVYIINFTKTSVVSVLISII